MARLIGFAQSVESNQQTDDFARSHAIRSAATRRAAGLVRSRNAERAMSNAHELIGTASQSRTP